MKSTTSAEISIYLKLSHQMAQSTTFDTTTSIRASLSFVSISKPSPWADFSPLGENTRGGFLSSFISDGYASQHLQYLPFGETFVDQRNTTYNTPYKFSAKEKDEETGYSYFGARYYWPEVSVWLSVDPMADQRSWLSPYNYCQWNPVGRVDPNGELDEAYMDEWKLLIKKDGSMELNHISPEGGDEKQTIHVSYEQSNGKETSVGNPIEMKGSKKDLALGLTSLINIDKPNPKNLAETISTAAIAASVDGPIPVGDIFALYMLCSYLVFDNSYPKPWYTDRPNNYIPNPYTEMNNNIVFPTGNGNNFAKWFVRMGGAAVLGRMFYEGIQPNNQTVPIDNTRVNTPSGYHLHKKQ